MFASRERQKVVFCLVLAAATLAFYNPIAQAGFILLDDVPYILDNPPVRAGLTWATVKWSFTTYHAGYWHPLTWLSHALDCQWFGLNPAGHHYVSLLFHAVNAVLLFLLLQEATALLWPSLMVGLLFALHPVNVESVAWAAERKNVLSMTFFLLALWAYGRYARRGGVGRYLVVALLFVLGLMAKPQIITLPCVLLLWDYWPLRRMFPKSGEADPGSQIAPRSFAFLVLEKIPLFVIVAVSSWITVQAQRSADAVRTLSEYSLAARVENTIVSYGQYLADLFWPHRLAPLYPHPGNSLPLWQVVVSSAVLLLLTALVVVWRDRRYLAVGWFWFLGVLVPMIGIVQVGEQARADRFVYIPMIGVAIALVWAVSELAEKENIPPKWLAVPAIAISLALGVLTYRQLGHWRNGETLWRYTLSVTKRNYMAHDNLAMVLDKQGRVAEAIPEFQAAEALHKYPLPQVLSMGIYEQRNGHAQDAIVLYEKVARGAADPGLQAMAWSQMGSAYAQLKSYDRARESYENALKVDADNAAALVGTGLLAQSRGDFALAAVQLSRALKTEPSDVGLLLLADALRRAGRPDEADAVLEHAKKVSGDFSQAQRSVAETQLFFGCKPVSDPGPVPGRRSQS